MGLADELVEWTDADIASYEVGRALGLFADQTFQEVKGVFWSNNPLGQALYDVLQTLTRAGVLECRDGLEFRWKTATPLDPLANSAE